MSPREAFEMPPILPVPERPLEPRRRPEAACANLDEWLFEDEVSTRMAKAICQRCVLRIPCLKFELRTPTSKGVRGGLTLGQRNQLRLDYGDQLATILQAEPEEA